MRRDDNDVPVGQQYCSLGMIDESHSPVYTSVPVLLFNVQSDALLVRILFGPQLGGPPPLLSAPPTCRTTFNLVPRRFHYCRASGVEEPRRA